MRDSGGVHNSGLAVNEDLLCRASSWSHTDSTGDIPSSVVQETRRRLKNMHIDLASGSGLDCSIPVGFKSQD
jgi:hypothetical protein